MAIKKKLLIVSIFLICLNIGCSGLFTNEEISESQIKRLHSQIEQGEYKQIYDESSVELHARISEEEFSKLMKQAVEKMENVDKALFFQESSLDQILPQVLDNKDWRRFKFEKLEKNGKKLEIILHWTKENQDDIFKLVGLVILENSESDKPQEFYI